jgi:hypothetical protein
VGGKRLAAHLVDSDGLVEQEFREATSREPGKSAAVFHPPKRESPITVEPVPTQHRRIGRDAGDRLDRVACDFVNASDVNHRATLYNMPRTGRVMIHRDWFRLRGFSFTPPLQRGAFALAQE